ncbi:MAG: two-component sensor histidine kinase [Lachnospiraceae bacterium]|nr:two-component sensor histidine kinase [Lachnospiraceae bacterium]
MKKKINLQFMIISAVGILLTFCLSTVIFYELFKREIMDELETYAHVIKNTEGYQNISKGMYDPNMDYLRVTIIEKNGKVLYDSHANIKEMENHIDRQEIKQALKYGTGKIIRNSDTVEKNTFYYAILLENGSVLRIAKEVRSIWSIFMKVIPIMAFIIFILFVMHIILSNFLAKSIIYPIEQMSKNMDHIENITTYKELMPFIHTIREQHENILKSSKMRQEFTANVSHELKTPLTAISGYSELIENKMTNEEETIRFAGEIHKSANRLLTLINDIIRLSQLDMSESEQEFACEVIDLYQIAEDCVNMLQISAEKHDVFITLHGNNAYLEGNKEMLEEVVYNLCDNAIRYNNRGGKVNVIVKPIKEKIYLCVEDNGIGISKEHQEHIFERFYRVDKSRSKSTGGTGLGLAIVKHIVQQHKANIELKSEKGEGTKIEIEFLKNL